MAKVALTLADVLDAATRPGVLYERLENNRVRCYACGHRCVIFDGQRGVCKVRLNRGGVLYVPWGYVAALQVDPIEKKPFFHAWPGARTLSFGMLGCDLHCSYCFPGDTWVVTDRGPVPLEELFQATPHRERWPDAEIAYPTDLRAVTSAGRWRKVRAIFQHFYRGPLVVLRPYYLPEVRCTPDHRIYATDDVNAPPRPVYAKDLTPRHYVAIPRRYAFSTPQVIDVARILGSSIVTYRIPWKLTAAERQMIAEATAQGKTSRQIGDILGRNPSYIRHVRRKLSRGHGGDTRSGGPILKDGMFRFPNERRPGIPASIPLDTEMARLLGYYCAEGSVSRSSGRPNSWVLHFSLALHETDLAERIRQTLARYLGVQAYLTRCATTLRVSVGKASVARLFQALAGGKAREKRVPELLMDAPRPVIQAFLEALVEGDGHRYPNGKISVTTVSQALAYGIAWLVLKLGYCPSIYAIERPTRGTVMGRPVRQAPRQFTVVWYETSGSHRKIIETNEFYLIPLRDVGSVDYEGPVYNMEVEEEHNYLAHFLLVSNCQNWVTSQALRDPVAGVPPETVSPEEMVRLAERYDCRVVVSTYNEPLITSEWAVDVFRVAKARGLRTAYVSNGNATREVLEYLRPWVDLYKVDLKSFRDRNYRKLGGRLDSVLDTIRMLVEMGFWVEVVTLVVPGFNDSDEELRDIARFLVSVSPDIPWHVTAFHKDYKMTDPDNTPPETLIRAARIGYEEGLRYVYAGNLPGMVDGYEDTYCPTCHRAVIRRYGFQVLAYRLVNGRCPDCQTPIPGRWDGGTG